MQKQYFVKTIISFMFLLLSAFAVVATQGEEVTITGIVTIWEWDDDNNATAVAISTEEEEYIVGANDLGEELLDLVDHDVEVSGTVSTNENDEKVILVTEYRDLGMTEIEDDDEESEPEEI